MSDNEKPLDPHITQPHGREQQLKMELLAMIESAADPYEIIYMVARRIEEASGEPGFAQYVQDQLRAVYGFALAQEKPLADELMEVKARLARIEEAHAHGDFTEEERTRIGFAIVRHQKNIERLEALLQRAKVGGTPPVFTKNRGPQP